MFNKKLLKKNMAIAIVLSVMIGGLSQTSYALDVQQIEQQAIDVSQINQPELRASQWYYATITLPTSQYDWWTTTTRSKTRIYPGTAINKPKYTAYSTIFRGQTTTNIGNITSHSAGKDTIAWHNVDKNETYIRGGFRNAVTNINNNKVDLRWSP